MSVFVRLNRKTLIYTQFTESEGFSAGPSVELFHVVIGCLMRYAVRRGQPRALCPVRGAVLT